LILEHTGTQSSESSKIVITASKDTAPDRQ
jgi:hypothetical protein